MSKVTSILVECHLEKEEGSESAWGHFRRCQRGIRKNEDLTRKGPALEATPEQSSGARGGARAALSPGGTGPCSWSPWSSSHRLAAVHSGFIAEMLTLCWFSREGGATAMLSSRCPPPVCAVFKLRKSFTFLHGWGKNEKNIS